MLTNPEVEALLSEAEELADHVDARVRDWVVAARSALREQASETEKLRADITSYADASTELCAEVAAQADVIDRLQAGWTECDRLNGVVQRQFDLLAECREVIEAVRNNTICFNPDNPPMLTGLMDVVNGPTYIFYGTTMNRVHKIHTKLGAHNV